MVLPETHNNLKLQQNVPPHGTRDGFRALSLSRKDGGAARGVPSAAAGDRKNLKTKCSTWRSIGGLRGPQKSKNQGATWSTAITPATGITRNKILESRLKTGDLGKVALLFGVTAENSAVSSSSVAKFGPEENLQQFQAR
ncbi:uncharacterized protein LOC144167856 isoform X1 [Haemaphysalis longicornis]